jgi:hypothetical protein
MVSDQRDAPSRDAIPNVMVSRDGKKKGRIINLRSRRCGMEGCRAYRASVRWEDGRLTYPCMAGVYVNEDGFYQIM